MTGGGIQALSAAGPGSGPGLWIDYLDYARRLFLKGADPWGDPARFVNAFSQAQQLLKSDLIDVRVEDYMASWLQGDGAALEPARRPTSDLKQILGDDSYRDGLVTVLATLGDLGRGCSGIALTIPSPRRWLRICVARAGGDVDEPLDEDYVEMAAMYIADYLRAFADSGISALLLEEDRDPGQDLLSLYQPVLNVAAGYQWDVGILIPGELTTALGGDLAVTIVDPAALAALAKGGAPCGVSVPGDYWAGKDKKFAVPEGCAAVYVRIPGDANPEQVLKRLAALREST